VSSARSHNSAHAYRFVLAGVDRSETHNEDEIRTTPPHGERLVKILIGGALSFDSVDEFIIGQWDGKICRRQAFRGSNQPEKVAVK
jgi:hypothetical protein